MSTYNGIGILLPVNFVCDKLSIPVSYKYLPQASKRKSTQTKEYAVWVKEYFQLIHALVTPKGAIQLFKI